MALGETIKQVGSIVGRYVGPLDSNKVVTIDWKPIEITVGAGQSSPGAINEAGRSTVLGVPRQVVYIAAAIGIGLLIFFKAR